MVIFGITASIAPGQIKADRLYLSIYFIRLRGHNKIVLMRSTNLMRPKLKWTSPPLRSSTTQKLTVYAWNSPTFFPEKDLHILLFIR